MYLRARPAEGKTWGENRKATPDLPGPQPPFVCTASSSSSVMALPDFVEISEEAEKGHSPIAHHLSKPDDATHCAQNVRIGLESMAERMDISDPSNWGRQGNQKMSQRAQPQTTPHNVPPAGQGCQTTTEIPPDATTAVQSPPQCRIE